MSAAESESLDVSHLTSEETELLGKLELAAERCDNHLDPEWPLRDVEARLGELGHDRVRRVVALRRWFRIESDEYQRVLDRAHELLLEVTRDE